MRREGRRLDAGEVERRKGGCQHEAGARSTRLPARSHLDETITISRQPDREGPLR
jgi:hypothetical protein